MGKYTWSSVIFHVRRSQMPELACGQFALLFSESLFHHRTRLNTDVTATELPEGWCHFCVLFGLDPPISPSHWCLCVSVSQHTVVTTVPMETASFTFHFQHQNSLYANHSSGWQQIRSKDLSESTQGSWRLTGHRHTSTQPTWLATLALFINSCQTKRGNR